MGSAVTDCLCVLYNVSSSLSVLRECFLFICPNVASVGIYLMMVNCTSNEILSSTYFHICSFLICVSHGRINCPYEYLVLFSDSGGYYLFACQKIQVTCLCDDSTSDDSSGMSMYCAVYE